MEPEMNGSDSGSSPMSSPKKKAAGVAAGVASPLGSSWSRKTAASAPGSSPSSSPISSPRTTTSSNAKASSTPKSDRQHKKLPTNTKTTTTTLLGNIMDAKRREDCPVPSDFPTDDESSLAQSARQNWMKIDAELQSTTTAAVTHGGGDSASLSASSRRIWSPQQQPGGKPKLAPPQTSSSGTAGHHGMTGAGHNRGIGQAPLHNSMSDSMSNSLDMSSSSLTVSSSMSPRQSPGGVPSVNRAVMNASMSSMTPQPSHRFQGGGGGGVGRRGAAKTAAGVRAGSMPSSKNKTSKKDADLTTVVRGSRVYKIGPGTNNAHIENFIPQSSAHSDITNGKSWIRKPKPEVPTDHSTDDSNNNNNNDDNDDDNYNDMAIVEHDLTTALSNVNEEGEGEDDDEQVEVELELAQEQAVEERKVEQQAVEERGVEQQVHHDDGGGDKTDNRRRRNVVQNDDIDLEDTHPQQVDKSGVREMIVDKVPKKKRWTSRNRENFPIWPPIIKVLQFQHQNTSGISLGSGFTNEDSLTASEGDFLSDLDEDDLSALEDLNFIAPAQRTSYRIRYDGPTNLDNLETIYNLPPVPHVDDRFDAAGGPSDANQNLTVQHRGRSDSTPQAPPRRAMSISDQGSIDTDFLSMNTTKTRPDVWITPLSGTQPANAIWKVKRVWEVESVDEKEEEHSVHNMDLFNKIKTLVGAPESPEQQPSHLSDNIPKKPSRHWHMQTVVEKKGEIEQLESEKEFVEEELRENMKKMNEDAVKEIELNAQALEEAKRRIRMLHGFDVPDQQKTPRRAPKMLPRRTNPSASPVPESPANQSGSETVDEMVKKGPSLDPQHTDSLSPIPPGGKTSHDVGRELGLDDLCLDWSPMGPNNVRPLSENKLLAEQTIEGPVRKEQTVGTKNSDATPESIDNVLAPLPSGSAIGVQLDPQSPTTDNDQHGIQSIQPNDVDATTPTSKKKKTKKKSVKGDSTPKTPSRRKSKVPGALPPAPPDPIDLSSPQSTATSKSMKKKKKAKSLKGDAEAPVMNGDDSVPATPSTVKKKKKAKSLKSSSADSTPKTPSRRSSVAETHGGSRAQDVELNDSSNINGKAKKKKPVLDQGSPQKPKTPRRSSRKKSDDHTDNDDGNDGDGRKSLSRRMITAGDMVQHSDSESETESSDIHSTRDTDGNSITASFRRLQSVTPWWQKNGSLKSPASSRSNIKSPVKGSKPSSSRSIRGGGKHTDERATKSRGVEAPQLWD